MRSEKINTKPKHFLFLKGITFCYVRKLLEQLNALNRTNINIQIVTVKVKQGKRLIYEVAYLVRIRQRNCLWKEKEDINVFLYYYVVFFYSC